MGHKKKLRSSMAMNIIGAIILLLVLLGSLLSMIGITSFTNVFKEKYAVSTYHMADTATVLVNGDHLDDYLAGKRGVEYLRTKANLDLYCQKISVSLIYIIKVDTSDYGRFVSIFNSVDNTVDNSEYTPWELGYERDTTNQEYRQKYQALYEDQSLYETVYRIKTTDGQHPHITTMVPIKTSAGKVVAILCMQRPVRELYDARRPYLINVAVSTALLSVLVSVAAAFFIRRQFVLPIQKVADEATRFAKDNTKGQSLGAISRYEELVRLAESIDTMESDMVRHIQNLTAITAEKERISTELSLAARIQEAMLPNVFPPFPDRLEFDIYASMDPAKEVGGDFYDFFLIDDDHLCIEIADVSGKGIPAALFMMASKIILANNAQMGKSPEQILTDTNAVICSNNRADMFITVWLGILELSTGKLTAANAGHEYPVLQHRGGAFALLKDKHGLVIGGMEGIQYHQYELQLEPGAKLFVYTDGVVEATDVDNQLFGTKRMVEVLNAVPDDSPEQILEQIRQAVDEFVKGAEQFDDLTMLCIQYNGPKTQETVISQDPCSPA